jgi:hypothetical protein
MTENENIAGFDKPQVPHDEWTAKQYEKHGLGETPSLKEIEPKATELLSNLQTSIAGAELVLGRRVDGDLENEPDVLPIIGTPGITAEEKFALLLMQKTIEDIQAEAAKNQG